SPHQGAGSGMILSCIVAVSENDVIGRDNDLPWHLSEDLKRFKRLTTGHAIIMGRGNWEAMRCRALPGRRNIVITRKTDYTTNGADVVQTLDEAMALVVDDDEPFIIGGGDIYRLALEADIVDTMYITRVDAEVEGDTTFPSYDASQWETIASVQHSADARHAYGFTILTLRRVATD
ncbi:MAG: dihydrofolate reductase, partial [Desulfobacterales bacterium]|nr:dihydrofolate reductase [Desulfobacterales bacterium]